MRRVPVSEAIQIQNGFAFESELFSERRVGLPVARIRDVIRGYSETYYTGKYPEEYEIQNGDLLIGMDGEFNVGVWRGGRALLNQRVCKIIPKDGIADKHYLKHRLALLVKQIEAETPYVTVKHLSSEELKAEEIELPPLAEQRRIAALLESADRLRRTRRYARQLSDTFLQSVFLEMFGDPLVNAQNWDVLPVEELLSIPAHIGTIVPAGDSGEQLCVRVGEVGGWYINLAACKRVSLKGRALDRFTLLPGDIVLARAIGSVAHLGKLSLLGKGSSPVVFDSHLMRLRPDESKIVTTYVTTLLHTNQGRALFMRQARRTAVQFNINSEQISQLRIPVPPLPLQQKFAEIVRRFERLRAQQREAERQAEHLFQTLLHRAFSSGL